MSELDFPDLGRAGATPAGPDEPPAAAGPDGPDDSPRGELLVGGAIIALFFVLFLGWAAFAPLDAGRYICLARKGNGICPTCKTGYYVYHNRFNRY